MLLISASPSRGGPSSFPAFSHSDDAATIVLFPLLHGHFTLFPCVPQAYCPLLPQQRSLNCFVFCRKAASHGRRTAILMRDLQRARLSLERRGDGSWTAKEERSMITAKNSAISVMELNSAKNPHMLDKSPERDPSELLPWLPCTLALDLPVIKFTVGDLLSLVSGSIIETAYHQSSDLPLRVNGQLVGWTEFEVVGERLAVRLTDLS